MYISANKTNVTQRTAPPQQQSADTITKRIVDATVDSTLAGTDRVSGSLAGLTTGVAAYGSKLPRLVSGTAQSVANLIKAETIGPNIKVIAGLVSPALVAVGAAGAGLGLVVSAGAGLVKGFTAHDSEKPRDFTINKAVDKAWNDTRKSVDEMAADMVSESREIREKKLAPGEDPWDIPLPPFGRTAQTMAATVAGVVIGGVGGLATALVTTAKGAWSGVKQMFTQPKDALASLGTVIGSPVTGVLHGASKVFTTPVKAAAVAWKQKSLGAALKAAGKEAFDSKPGAPSTAIGAAVGGLSVAVPASAFTAVATGAQELVEGVKTVAGDKDLNASGKALAALGTVIAAPVSGLTHGVATGVALPFLAAAKSANHTLVEGVTTGLKSSHRSTRPIGNAVGAAAGGMVIGGVTAATATATAVVSELGGGLVEAATNKRLNLGGKLLDGLGGIPGDAVTALGQGIGNLVMTPVQAGIAGAHGSSAADGVKRASQVGVKAVLTAAHPQRTLLEEVQVK